MGALAAAWRTCLGCGPGWLGAVVGRHAAGHNGRCASNRGFLNGRARRLEPFSTAGAHRLRAFVHYRSSAIVACILYWQRSLLPLRERDKCRLASCCVDRPISTSMLPLRCAPL